MFEGRSARIEDVHCQREWLASLESLPIEGRRPKDERARLVLKSARPRAMGPWLEHLCVSAILGDWTIGCSRALRIASNLPPDRPQSAAKDIRRFSLWKPNRVARPKRELQWNDA